MAVLVTSTALSLYQKSVSGTVIVTLTSAVSASVNRDSSFDSDKSLAGILALAVIWALCQWLKVDCDEKFDSEKQYCGTEIIFSDPYQALTLISDPVPDPDCLWKTTFVLQII
jgi:hypothetical protein